MKDIDLDVMNAMKQLKEHESILYLRNDKNKQCTLSKGTTTSIGIGVYEYIVSLGHEHLNLIEIIEEACDDYRIKHFENPN